MLMWLSMDSQSLDRVVLLDDDGRPIGSASKASVHGPDTRLHLAFSCHVLDRSDRVLLTRRSLHKATWPGVWSNSFCGHPEPAEQLVSAVKRRAEYELGLTLSSVQLALPTFRYRAVDASGIAENEICPVYIATTSGEPRPRADEVMDHAWVDPLDLGRAIRLTPVVFSPWLVLQARRLPFLGGGGEDLDGPAGSTSPDDEEPPA